MQGLIANTPYGSIEYRLEGNGPVVMVLNGGHCSRDTRLSHERLAQHGFYEALRQWVCQNHQLDVKYKTLYTIVRTRFKAKLKVPRPSHTKKP
jgi:hypothetical protein